MIRVAGFVTADALFLLGLLTLVEAPGLLGWKLAIVATQFGQWLAIVALILAGVAGWRAWAGSFPFLASGTAIFAGAAAVLFIGPSWRASRIAANQSAALAAGMHVAPNRLEDVRSAFSWATLFRPTPSIDVDTDTYEFARGRGYALSLDVVRARGFGPVDGSARTPCVVLVHGGGWNGGERGELADFTRWLTTCGVAVATVDYRLAPTWTWPAPRDDVHAAIRWLRENARQLHLDPDKFFLFGRSAGAQIALAVACDPASAPVRGIISFYGPADLNFAYTYGREDDVLKSPALLRDYLGGPPDQRQAAYDDASPYLQVRSGLPPILLVHGQLDTLVWRRQSERFEVRLREAGVPVYFLSVPAASHALEFNLHGPGGQLACAAVAGFLDIALVR